MLRDALNAHTCEQRLARKLMHQSGAREEARAEDRNQGSSREEAKDGNMGSHFGGFLAFRGPEEYG